MGYQGDLNFAGGDSLTIDVDDLGNTGDGAAMQASAVVGITVNPVNDEPVATAPANFTAIAGEANAFTGGSAITVSDVDVAETPGGTLQMQLTVATGAGPDPGFLTVPGGTNIVGGANNSASVTIEGTVAQLTTALNGLTYTPPATLFGAATLTIDTTDQGNTGSGGVKTDQDIVNISSVPPVVPFAINDAFVFEEDSVGSPTVNVMDVLDNDRAEVGSVPTLLSFTQPAANATVALVPGVAGDGTDDQLTITPDGDFEGTVTFTYTINELPGNGGDDSTATVTVDFLGLNDDPVAVNDGPNASLTTDEDTDFDILGGVLTGNDSPGPGEEATQTLTVISATASVGSVSVLNNIVTYSPPQDFNDNLGTATITYVTEDNGKDLGVDAPRTATAVATLSITPVNDKPVGTPDSDTTVEDTDLIINVADLLADDGPGGGADEAGQLLSLDGFDTTSAEGGSLSLSGGQITYSPPDDFFGTDTFNYTINDGDLISDDIMVTIDVTSDNDAPEVTNDMVDAIKNIDKQIDAAFLLSNDNPGGGTLESGQGLTVTAVSASSAQGGTVSLSGTTITYSPPADYFGPDSFTYTATDNGTPNESTVGTVNVDVEELRPQLFPGVRVGRQQQ